MKPDQEQVKNLLVESIAILCRNGLQFKANVSIQGLLGITLDDQEIFLVNIHEKICETSSGNVETVSLQIPHSGSKVVTSVDTEEEKSRKYYPEHVLYSEKCAEKESLSSLPPDGADSQKTVDDKNDTDKLNNSESGNSKNSTEHRSLSALDSHNSSSKISKQTHEKGKIKTQLGLKMHTEPTTSGNDSNENQPCALEMRVNTELEAGAPQTQIFMQVTGDGPHYSDIEEESHVPRIVKTEDQSCMPTTVNIEGPDQTIVKNEDVDFEFEGNVHRESPHGSDPQDKSCVPRTVKIEGLDLTIVKNEDVDIKIEGNEHGENLCQSRPIDNATGPEYSNWGYAGKDSASKNTQGSSTGTQSDQHDSQNSQMAEPSEGYAEQPGSSKHQYVQHSYSRGKKGEKICPYCNKDCRNTSYLNRHIRMHTGDKPFKCHDCGKTFTQKGSLKIHSVVHTGERPYTCDWCGKTLKFLGNFKRHLLRHTGEKAFACKICGKKFPASYNLKEHMLIHNKLKGHSCNVCGKAYTHSQNLRKHMKKSH